VLMFFFVGGGLGLGWDRGRGRGSYLDGRCVFI